MDSPRGLFSLFMQAPVAISVQEGPEHVYVLANSAYRQFLGNRELVGLKRRDVLPDFARLARILDEVYASGVPYVAHEQAFQVSRGDGQWVEGFFNLTCQPYDGDDGQRAGVITFGFEVTDLVRARKDKEALAEDLAAAVRARDTFLSVASHELRTPLTTLQLQSDGLMRSLEGPLDVERLRYRVGKIQQQSLRLNRLIGDLLDVSRITAGRLTLQREPADLRPLVEEALARAEEALSRSGSAVELRAESVVGEWDRLRLEQVVSNLIMNAAKYGGGKPVSITVGADGNTARIEVRDRGIGIAPADQARIFERFERAVSERNFGGLGLGLWISKQIVAAHGGLIRVESHPGEGSTFTVELPIKANA
jgi:signal transduction histidine kinase